MQATSDMSLISLLVHASIPVQLVMLVLLAISVLSWTYIFSKRAALKRAGEQTQRFEDDFWAGGRSEEHTSELQSRPHLVCRLLLEKKKKITLTTHALNHLRR